MADASESLTSIPAVSAVRHTSLVRGLACAILFGVCGFCIPFAVLSIAPLLEIAYTRMEAIDRAEAFEQVFEQLFGNAVGCAIVCSVLFATSALANFTPRQGIGFARSFFVMTGFMFGAGLVMSYAGAVFYPDLLNIGRKGASAPPLVYVFCMIYILILAGWTVAFTHWQIRRSGGSP
jgi:hypothetical protein